MADNEYFDAITHLWDEEGFFARNMNGQLIRVVPATAKDYDEIVTVTIDGQEVQVPRAVPATDAQGNLINDADGRTVPRKTTILDAAVALFCRDNPAARLPIPTLCHAEHLRPVGVCRVCSVEVGRLEPDRNNPGKMREIASGKLVPACVQPVEPGMIVYTLESTNNEKAAARVQSAVKVLLELLSADHLAAASSVTKQADDARRSSDLERLVQRLGPTLGVESGRFARRIPLSFPRDDSSQLIAINHDACILCDRCSRSCNEVKQNLVIGRTGKGYTTRVGFDLNDPMGDSSCVSCGECMLACPTNALTFRKPILSDWWAESVERPGNSAVSAAELEDHPLLGALSYRFRQWNESSIIRRRVKAGDELCRLGDYGSTAFLLNSGEFGIYARDPRVGVQSARRTGLLGWLQSAVAGKSEGAQLIADLGKPTDISTAKDVILGEMTCLSHFPRTATIVALTDGEVFEVRRNVLFALQRNPKAREILDRVYRQRALRAQLDAVPFFSDLSAEERDRCREFLRDKVQLLRVDPGQMIFRQGEPADAFYMVRLGYVKFTQTSGGQEQVLNYLGPNKSFGEIGLVAEMPQLAVLIPESLRNRRTAACSALDDVELVRIAKSDFQEMLQRFEKLQNRFASIAQGLLARQTQPTKTTTVRGKHLQAFTEQGLFNGQKLLVLDLEACTRCDECSKACADTHQGVTRLIRDGLRFDKWLVASACRSCSDPYCLVGCPVDAIHRDGERKEITIESHCIGCGLCANNCPYGNINMHGIEEILPDPNNDRRAIAVVQQRATTCDLCHHIVGPQDQVSCVFACPHNAAFRMSGEELLEKV